MRETFSNLLRSIASSRAALSFLWEKPLLWLCVAFASLIASSYYMILIALVSCVGRTRDLAFNRILLMFSGFVAACGTMELSESWIGSSIGGMHLGEAGLLVRRR
jgi:hypothetical protein